MTQSDFGTINPTTKTGTALASDLNGFRNAQNTSHRGASRPSYAQTGMVWNDSDDGSLNYFNGTSDEKIPKGAVTTYGVSLIESADADAAKSTLEIVDPFDTVADLTASSLGSGVLVDTKGYTTAGDGGGARYLIQTAAEFGGTPNGYGDHTLANGNVAVLQNNAINSAQYGMLESNSAADNDSALSAIVSAAAEGQEVQFESGSYGLIQTGHAFSNAVRIVCKGSVNFNLNAVDSGDFITFAWSAGKPYANAIIGQLTINANDTGGDTVVMRGINWYVDDLVIRNAGRDGFVLRTDASSSWFIENFHINKLEVDGAQRNCLAYQLALKSSGSFINEGLIENLELREAGKGGNGTEIKYIVPENTYSANKISSIVYVKTNIDMRSAARTEPFAVKVDRDSGVTNGSAVEHQMFINGAWENTQGTIAGSSMVDIDPNCTASRWKFIDVFESDVDSFFSGTALVDYFRIDKNGYIQTSKVQTSGTTPAWRIGTTVDRLCQMLIQTGDSGLVGNVDNSADEMIIENSDNAGMTILSPNNKFGRIAFGDQDSSTVGQFRYDHNDDSFDIVTNANKVNSQDSNGNLIPGATGAQDLGSESLRYNHAHLSRLKLLDGISTPPTVTNWAFIYVDSGDGDLKIKFGDGTIKTIVTDT